MEDPGSKTRDQEVGLLVIRCSCQVVEISLFIEKAPAQMGTELWEDRGARLAPCPDQAPLRTPRPQARTECRWTPDHTGLLALRTTPYLSGLQLSTPAGHPGCTPRTAGSLSADSSACTSLAGLTEKPYSPCRQPRPPAPSRDLLGQLRVFHFALVLLRSRHSLPTHRGLLAVLVPLVPLLPPQQVCLPARGGFQPQALRRRVTLPYTQGSVLAERVQLQGKNMERALVTLTPSPSAEACPWALGAARTSGRPGTPHAGPSAVGAWAPGAGTYIQAAGFEEAGYNGILVAPQRIVDEVVPALGPKHPGGHISAPDCKAPRQRRHSTSSAGGPQGNTPRSAMPAASTRAPPGHRSPSGHLSVPRKAAPHGGKQGSPRMDF